MIPILFYVLKVILCSAILYSYYWLVLRNNRFHQYNRFYLLGCTVLSWLMPLIKIEIIKEQLVETPNMLHVANIIATTNTAIEQDVIDHSVHFSWDNLVFIFGITFSVFLMVRLIKSLMNIRRFIRIFPVKKLSGMYLVLTDVKGAPFSFFKYIFWNTSIDLKSEVGKKILAHEIVHVEEHHSFDKLWIELQLVAGWFNPVTWLIKNELYLIHEFIADHKSLQNQDTGVLAELLFTSAYPAQNHLLTNSFFFSPIKRRIQMFSNSKNIKFSYLRRLTILPIIAATVLLFAFRNGTVASRPITKLDRKYTVFIDAGHGGNDLGATALDGTNEKDLVLDIALKVKSLNNNPNIDILLSRDSDKFVKLSERTNLANSANANLFLSIHLNNDASKLGTGIACYVPFKKNLYVKESTLLAKNILAATSNIFTESKLVNTGEKGIYVIENTKMPSVLFECGFISNAKDLKIIQSDEDKIARLILDGVSSYLSNKK
jgi:N-acetylmuramoyl-L-alanine amidase